MSFTLPDPGLPKLEFEQPAGRARLEQAVQALRARGFKAQIADSGAHAKELVLAALPEGAEVHTALSETLSQLGAYAYAAGEVILVVGHQKLVRDVEEGLRRVREYSLPREFARMQTVGYPGSLLAKTLLIEYEPSGRITVILVPEKLGF